MIESMLLSMWQEEHVIKSDNNGCLSCFPSPSEAAASFPCLEAASKFFFFGHDGLDGPRLKSRSSPCGGKKSRNEGIIKWMLERDAVTVSPCIDF